MNVVLDAVNVVDDVEHCLRADTSLHLAEQLTGHRRFVHATLPQVLAGEFETPADRTVIFSPFGLGILDLVLAQAVYRQCRSTGRATTITDFFDGPPSDGSDRPRPRG